jgi:hypothetical protein
MEDGGDDGHLTVEQTWHETQKRKIRYFDGFVEADALVGACPANYVACIIAGLYL